MRDKGKAGLKNLKKWVTSIFILNYKNGFEFLSTNYARTQIIEKVFLVKSLQKEIKQVVLLLEETITKGVCSISK